MQKHQKRPLHKQMVCTSNFDHVMNMHNTHACHVLNFFQAQYTENTPQIANKENITFQLLEMIIKFWKKVLKSTHIFYLWDTKLMNTTLKLCLYCSIERNLDVSKTCIFLFGGFGVGSLIFIKFLNLWSKNSRDGLEWKIFWSRLWMHKMIRL